MPLVAMRAQSPNEPTESGLPSLKDLEVVGENLGKPAAHLHAARRANDSKAYLEATQLLQNFARFAGTQIEERRRQIRRIQERTARACRETRFDEPRPVTAPTHERLVSSAFHKAHTKLFAVLHRANSTCVMSDGLSVNTTGYGASPNDARTYAHGLIAGRTMR